ncbi:MAG TPA: hypothetical protein ENI94_13010 [Gammaproteobacteria bacterium]|nr:hypothetical protein [Gammaproteobacteria bacterium]
MTDINTTLNDLDAGIFMQKIDKALRDTALGVVTQGRIGKVIIELKLEQIGESNQVNMTHKLKYDKPTARGKLVEEDATETPLYVCRGGALSLMPDTQGKFEFNTQKQETE